MDKQQVRRVVVAGGGTAGWLAAAALARQLGSILEITLIESDEIGTVGVGESTIPTIHTFHRFAGIDEREFMRATQASFKLGISFENWAREGDYYFHSFGEAGKSTWMGGFQHFWLRGREDGVADELGAYCFELQAAEQNKFLGGENTRLSYAYHLDAGLYGRYLRSLVEGKGVRRVEGKIGSVEQDPETGFITALKLESGERIEGDLFIDCTGFRGLLIDKTLNVGWEDWGHWLLTNSAIAVQTAATGPAVPYTRAIAHRAGWRWKIPLQHRVGNGLVYSNAHMSDDEAHALVRGSIEGDVLIEPRVIRFKAGRRKKSWEKNCITMGLSSGFVEPLESTSIHLIMIGIVRLMQLFPTDGITEALAERYNDLADRELIGIRDFIILHYKLNERADSDFWRTCRDMDVPDSLAYRIELFREHAQAYQAPDELFRIDSWMQVMLGQRLQPRTYHPMAKIMSKDQLRQSLADMKGAIASAVAQMPSHQEFLDRYCGAPVSTAA